MRRGRPPRRRDVAFATSPVLRQALPPWRSKLILALVFCAFAVLLGRAFWVQVVSTEFYVEQGRKRYETTIALPATRGKIVDRAGRTLAVSLPVKAIWAIPEDFPRDPPPARLQELVALLGTTSASLMSRLDAGQRFVYLQRQVPLLTARHIAELGIPGVHQIREAKRFYPEGEVAAHVVGFTNVEDDGQEGVELAQQASLAGAPGRRGVIRDRLGRVIDDAGLLKPAHDGAQTTLSIDSRIQNLAFTELKAAIDASGARAGAAVVLDARTGEILALANWPTFDPNDRTHLAGARLRNRALTDTFEPGSAIKPINIALALEKNIVDPASSVETAPGWYRMGGYTIRDTSNHGTLSVAEVIKKSSNIGMLKIMQRLPARDMWEMFYRVGFGRPPVVAFPGAAAGRIRPYQNWRPVEQATMAYGYGLSVSLLQLAQSYTIFAGNGEFTPATLECDPLVNRLRVISPHTASAVRDMLELAAAPDGTARQARIPGYRVGAKTGTARKQEGRGYAASKYRVVFVGLAPLSDPEAIVAVIIDEPSKGPKYGGPVAGPPFARIMRETLRWRMVPPDAEVISAVLEPRLEPEQQAASEL